MTTMTIQQIARDHLGVQLSDDDFKVVRRKLRKLFASRIARSAKELDASHVHVYRDRHVYDDCDDAFSIVCTVINDVARYDTRDMRRRAYNDARRDMRKESRRVSPIEETYRMIDESLLADKLCDDFDALCTVTSLKKPNSKRSHA